MTTDEVMAGFEAGFEDIQHSAEDRLAVAVLLATFQHRTVSVNVGENDND